VRTTSQAARAREDDEDDEHVVVVHGVEYAVDDDPDIFAAEAEAEEKIKKPVDSGPDAGDGEGKKKPKPSDPSDPSEPMTDDEALRAMEKIVRATMSSSAARTIARELVALGADTPARARRLLVGASANYILFELVAVAVNAAVAFGMYVLFQSAESYFFTAPPVQGGGGPFVMDGILRTLAKFGPFALGGVFAIESLAHATIAGSMIATATFFGFADLDAFSAAVLKLGGGGGKGGGEGEDGEGFLRSPSSIVPGVASVRDAATSLRVARRLARLRAAVDAELRAKGDSLIDSPGRSSVERLAALFELTAAETERGFDPSAYGVSESEALRLAALFADFDDDGDGFVGPDALGRLLRELNRAAREEDDARGVECFDARRDASFDFADPAEVEFAEPIRPSIRPSTSFDSSDKEVDFADPAEVSAAFEALDGDGDGRVSLEEFVAWVVGGCPVAANADETSARVVGAIGEETPAEEAAVEAIRD